MADRMKKIRCRFINGAVAGIVAMALLAGCATPHDTVAPDAGGGRAPAPGGLAPHQGQALPPAPAGVGAAGGGDSLQELATKSLNPVAKMMKVPVQNNFNFGVGPNQVTPYTLNLQPVIPVTINADWNLITRTVVPVISQPSPETGVPGAYGLGDVNPALLFSPATSGKQFWGLGPAATFPTGTSSPLTSGQWSLGPAAVYMATPGQWMLGGLASQQWSVGGWSDRSVNVTNLEPMLIYHLPEGWYLCSMPTITADWTADTGNRWTVPVGGGVGKVVRLGNLPVNLQLQAFQNVEKPDNLGADWQLRFQLLFLFPK